MNYDIIDTTYKGGKTMKKLLLIISCLFITSACGSKQIAKSSSTCSLLNDTLNTTIELQAENNIVVRAITSSTLTQDAFEDIDLSTLTEEEKLQIKDIVSKSIAASDETKGIQSEVIFEGDRIIVNSTINIEDADETFLQDLDLTNKAMTLNEAVEAIESNGATCR